MQPLISVIVPIYNSEDSLGRCIDSLLSQTYGNLEIILVNDGSTDKSLDICMSYSEKHGNIKVLSKPNGGVSSARNLGLDNATGAYYGFVDSDDYIDSDMYSALMENALANDADISQVMIYGYEQKDFPSDIISADNNERLKLLLEGRIFSSVDNKIYKAELFSDVRMDEDMHIAEDFLCTYMLVRKAKRIVLSSKPLYHYVYRDGSAMNRPLTEEHFLDAKVFEYMLSQETDPEIITAIHERMVRTYMWYIERILLGNRLTERFDHFRTEIIRYKAVAFRSNIISIKFKAKIILLWLSPWLYKTLFRIRHKTKGDKD